MIIKLIDFGGLKPKRAHVNDAGADVFSPETFVIMPHQTKKVPLGFGLELPDGFVGFIFPRSSLSAKGIICQLPPIDSGYRGEVHAVLTNEGDTAYTVHAQDRIGQLVILPCLIPELSFEAWDERGQGAFGSTGK